ncbi:hypothetical protein AC630_13245 [Bradyrhizobium sp. AS23.2]|nr:hypothetical protein AC630_13245 [Bradyrhizobium sp. AS23.2]
MLGSSVRLDAIVPGLPSTLPIAFSAGMIADPALVYSTALSRERRSSSAKTIKLVHKNVFSVRMFLLMVYCIRQLPLIWDVLTFPAD